MLRRVGNLSKGRSTLRKVIPFCPAEFLVVSSQSRCKSPFRKRSLPFETVDAISQNGRCHLKRSMPFLMTVDAKKEPIFPTLSDDMHDNQSNA